MIAALLVISEAGNTFGLINIQPVIDCIWLTNFQQTVQSHPMGGLTFGNFQ